MLRYITVRENGMYKEVASSLEGKRKGQDFAWPFPRLGRLNCFAPFRSPAFSAAAFFCHEPFVSGVVRFHLRK
jgi:hypothetical protein